MTGYPARRAGHLALLLALATSACSTTPVPDNNGMSASSPDAPTPSPTAEAATPSDASISPAVDPRGADLDRLARLFQTRHAAEIDLTDDLARLRASLNRMSDAEFLVAVMRLAAGREGDGHTGVFPVAQPQRMWPVQLYDFDDGWRVVAASPQYRHLIGHEVTGVGGRPVSDAAELAAPLVPRDNEASLRGRLPQYLVVPAVLEGLGLEATLQVEGEVVVPDTVGSDQYAEEFDLFYPLVCPPLPWSGPLWSIEEREGAVIVTVRRMVFDSDGRSSDELAQEVRRSIDREDPSRVVLDLRDNPGGELSAATPLVEALRSVALQRPGSLRLLVNRCTFSAAALSAADLLAGTDAVLVGEPMGGAPRIWADSRPYALVGSGVIVHVATRPYEAGAPGMPALITPDLSVAVTWEDWSAGRDRALEAALR